MGSKSTFEKLHFKRFQGFSKCQQWSVNLTFNAFLHRKFSFSYIDYDSRGSWRGSKIDVFLGFTLKYGQNQPLTPCAHVWDIVMLDIDI